MRTESLLLSELIIRDIVSFSKRVGSSESSTTQNKCGEHSPRRLDGRKCSVERFKGKKHFPRLITGRESSFRLVKKESFPRVRFLPLGDLKCGNIFFFKEVKRREGREPSSRRVEGRESHSR